MTKLLHFSLFILSSFNMLFSQNLTVQNPSFEGATGPHITPPLWGICMPGKTPDTQPGEWGVVLAPSDGNSYIGLAGDSNLIWFEGASQELRNEITGNSDPMQAGQTYHFTIDVSDHPTSGGWDVSGPVELLVWGGFSDCDKSELLWSSGDVPNFIWTKYNVSFSPSMSFTHIMFQCNTLTFPTGYLIIDNMSSITPSSNNVSFNNPCYGDSSVFTISNTSVDSVLWDFGDPNSGTHNNSTEINPFHIFSDTGTFHITLYSYFNGMIDTVVNDLFVTAIPIVNLGNDTVMCEGEILTLDATVQNATYLWQDNSTSSIYTVSVAGDYFVDVTVNGCANSDTIYVNYNFLPEAIISGDYEICYGGQADIEIIVNGSSPFEMTYTNGSDTNVIYGNDSIIIEASQSGIYEITNVLDQYDCIGNYSGSAEIIINPCSLSVYVPNAFTPNVDAYNQVFMPSIYDIENVVNYNMTIFNRWGEIIFETNEVGIYWDGKFNNTIVQQGIYAYTITITDIFEKLYDFNGYIYLIR